MKTVMPAVAPLSANDLLLSNLSPGPAQKRLAILFVLVILVVFAMITVGPLSGVQLSPIDSFVPVYTTALFLNDTVTAILLYAQFSIQRSRATLLIASGYLFAALMVIPFVLVFPGLLASQGGLVGGMQSTSYIYFAQHAGFPVFILGYAYLKDRKSNFQSWNGSIGPAIALSVAGTIAIVLIAASIPIFWFELLPAVTLDARRLSPLWPYVGAPVALLSIWAIAVLWARRRSALDLWLMVVMLLFSLEIPLSYYPDPARFSVGWYSVRIIGVLSSALVLIVLLHEITTLYERMLRSMQAQRLDREARLVTSNAIAATIAHEVRQPLSAMTASADAGLRFLSRSIPDSLEALEALKQVVADGHRAKEVIESIRANFKNDVRVKAPIDVNDLMAEAIALLKDDLQLHRIQVRMEPNPQSPHVIGDRGQLQQVFLNLTANAIDSMATAAGPRILSIGAEVRDASVIVSVADNGTELTSHDIERVFNAADPSGMGLGLSICRSIVETHDGRLSVVANKPRGAVFQFALRAVP